MRYPKEMWILAIGSIINMAGMSFLWPLNTIYISQELGRSVSLAGFVLMLHAGAGILGSLLGGYLHDRIGGKKSIGLGVICACLCVFSLACFHGWNVYVTMMVLLGFSNGMIFPALYAITKQIWPQGGRRAFNLLYLAQNLGVALGSALGGVVAQFSFTAVFVTNGCTYLFFLILIMAGLSGKQVSDSGGDGNHSEEEENQNAAAGGYLAKSGMISLLVLCLGFMACWIAYVQWSTNISSYMHDLGYSISSYSLLWTVNGLLIVACQPILSFFTGRYITTLRSQLLTGVIVFVLSMLVLSQTTAYTGFVIGMMVITLGEMFIWPAVPTAAAWLAPEGKSGIYQGIVNGAATAGRMVGPLVGGIFYDWFSPQAMLYAMIFFCAIGFLCFFSYERVGVLLASERKKINRAERL